MDEDGLQSVSPRGLQPKPPKSSLLSCPLHLTVGGPCVGRGGGVGGTSYGSVWMGSCP